MYSTQLIALFAACGALLAENASAASTQRVRRSTNLSTGATWANLAWGNINDSPSGKDVVFVDMDKGKGSIPSYNAAGQTVICYMSAGTVESWRSDASELKPYISEKSKYPGESWLDITKWDSFKDIMAKRMDRAKAAGCDGMEADNVDCFQNECVSGVSVSTLTSDEIQYTKWLARTAHSKGLKIGLKNALALIDDVSGDFDFGINESCTRFNECKYYQTFHSQGKAVFGVEYSAGSASCSQASEYGISMKYQSGGWNNC